MRPQHTAYLVAIALAPEFTISHVRIYSEPPWGMTRRRNDGAMGVLLEANGDSYQEARDSVLMLYTKFMPELAERFPVPS